MSQIIYLATLLLVGWSRADNSTEVSEVSEGDACRLPDEGPWSAALEDWVTAERVTQGRHGRIMALPSAQGFNSNYYVSERIDLMPPPPPPHHHQHGPPGVHGPHHMSHRGPYPMHHSGQPHGHQNDQGPPEAHNAKLQSGPKGSGPSNSGPPPSSMQNSEPMPYDEWQATPPPPPGAGKIVNRPPYKDQFKPSYPPPSPPHQQSIPVRPGALSDRVDEVRPPPQKQVSETDLYLLGAIEKLVYRVDFMEKRLRKMEENLHYLVAGTEVKPEPCEQNYTRVGSGCYHFSSEALNWKNANYACRKVKGYLLELDEEEKKQFTTGVLANKNYKGLDFWSGGLNPGLLWIWSHSAAAVGNSSAGVAGDGRCLALVHDPAVNGYVYRGQDCALRHRYVCEKNEDKTKLGNEIERVARHMRSGRARTARTARSARAARSTRIARSTSHGTEPPAS